MFGNKKAILRLDDDINGMYKALHREGFIGHEDLARNVNRLNTKLKALEDHLEIKYIEESHTIKGYVKKETAFEKLMSGTDRETESYKEMAERYKKLLDSILENKKAENEGWEKVREEYKRILSEQSK